MQSDHDFDGEEGAKNGRGAVLHHQKADKR